MRREVVESAVYREERARPLIAGGELIECLAPWCADEEALYLYYPTRKYLSAGLRAVIEAPLSRWLPPPSDSRSLA